MSFDKNAPLPSRDFNNLVKLINVLRNECPWDRKQTHDSLKYLMIEEMYEALESIDAQDFDELKKELGDILLHVVFHAEIATENRHFDIGDVIYNIMEKLIRRHPHVFNGVDATDEETVKRNWESIKKSEGQRKSVLEGVPGILPGLLMAQR
ncbi:MAG: MazG family protein, partial [Rhodothermaceae bacterium]|nr:MazG family protein [Rhodothermaceae bacterium]